MAPAPSSPSATSAHDDYVKLIDAEGYPKLGDYMHEAFPGKVVANFGGKYYQVASTAASSSDIWVTYGSKKDVDVAWGLPWSGKYRGPSGGNVPDSILNDNRFKISTGNNATPDIMPTPATPLNDYYRTDVDKPAYLYAEDGRMVPGPYDTNEGGDDWVVDAAIKVVEGEDWSAMHLNFSGIDKIGHMWGAGAGRHGRHLRLGSRDDHGSGAHALDRQERRRAGRQAHRGAASDEGDWNSTLGLPRSPATNASPPAMETPSSALHEAKSDTVLSPMPRGGTLITRMRPTLSAGLWTSRRYASASLISLR